MKNRIRSEIVKLAKQILAEENNFDARLMKRSIAKLYEQLTVLDYLESQLEDDENMELTQSLDSKSFREENWFTEPEPLPQSQHKEELVEPLMEKIKDIVAQMPEETQRVDDLLDEVLPKKEFKKNDLEEFASNYPDTPTFERKVSSKGIDVLENKVNNKFPVDQKIKTHPNSQGETLAKPQSLNDKLNKGLNVGLNDSLAFIKHLFNESTEDYTRVLSKLSEMNSFNDAEAFIKGKIKPKYNYWLKKEEYSERFMAIVEKSFN